MIKTITIGSEGRGYYGKRIVELYLKMAFPNITIIWDNTPNCDIIVASHSHWEENWNTIKKPYIYFSGESYPLSQNRCHSHSIEIVTTINNSENSIYCPYVVFSPYWTKNVRLYSDFDRPNKLAYCASNPCSIREELFDLFVTKDRTNTCHSIGQCYGSYPHTNYPIKEKNWTSRKLIKTYANYTFVLAMENQKASGYVTEKIMNVYASGAIPIYWGDAMVKQLFNQDSFIDVSDFPSLEDCVDYVLSLPKEKINWMMQQPIYAENDPILNIHKYSTELYDFNSLDLDSSPFYQKNLEIFNSLQLMSSKDRTISPESMNTNEENDNKFKGLPPVYYISLEDRIDRQQSIEQQFKKYGIEDYTKISAFDGRNSDLKEFLVGDDPYMNLTPCEIGCTLSHLKAMDHWLNNNSSNYALICEDDLDLSLADYWNFTWSDFITHLPKNWDCIQLTTIISIENMEMNLHERKEDEWSAACYLINRKYAEKLVTKYKHNEKYNLSLDHCQLVPELLIYLNSKTYSINLLTYKTELGSDIHPHHIDCLHQPSRNYVINWWKTHRETVKISSLMQLPLTSSPLILSSLSQFPLQDHYWLEVRNFLNYYLDRLDPILAPTEFIEFFPGVYPYSVSSVLPTDHFKFIVFHKGMVDQIELSFTLTVIKTWKPVFANPVFVIYTQNFYYQLPKDQDIHIPAFLEQIETLKINSQNLVKPDKYAITVTTYNRPHCLKRSLPQFLALGVPIIVIDDASTPENSQANQEIVDRYQVPLIRIPENRGLPNATNIGIHYWLADPDITWISYLQDDVDVHPDTLKILAKIQDPIERPLLSGHHTPVHPTLDTKIIAGYTVRYKPSTNGLHLHAHRDYWASVLPIPTPYLGAPKAIPGKPHQGSDEDWWITTTSPHSITKRGGYVICVPGLVDTFMLTAEESTWGAVNPLFDSVRFNNGVQNFDIN